VTDAIEQVLISKRLLNRLESTLPSSLHSHRYITMTSNKNNGEHAAEPVELLLNLEPAHLWLANVEHQAAGGVELSGRQKLARPLKNRGLEPGKPTGWHQSLPDAEAAL
jgi:hypothetical protein